MATQTNDKTPPFLKKITEWDEQGVAKEVKFILGNKQEVIVNMLEVSDENFYHAAVHGISQRLGDSCSAFSKDKDYGAAFDSLQALKDQLKTKEWSREREKGAQNRQQLEDLIGALAKIKKQPEEVVRAVVEKATPETLKKWTGNTTVAAEMADIKARRLKLAAKQAVDEIDLGI
jgi:hypothetical protein